MSDAAGGSSEWKTFGERAIYDNPWVWLGEVDVELPDGERSWHHVVRLHRAAMTVLAEWNRLIESALYGLHGDHPGGSGRALLSFTIRRVTSHAFN